MFNEILKTISEFDRIILHRHSHPDGDAIGSQLGLYHLIKDNFSDKEVYKVGDDASRFAFLEGSAPEEIPDSYYDGALAIILDCGAAHMISDERYKLAKKTIRFDHHLFCENVADIDCVDSTYESCCGLVAMFAKQTGLNLSLSSATALYLGMVTDSGRFRFDSTTARTFELAAYLLSQPIDVNYLYYNLYADDFDSLKQKANNILKIKFTQHNTAYIYTTLEEVKASGGDFFSISRGLVGLMADIKNVFAWVNFTEWEDGVHVELRSNKYNINPIAVKYGGGGHKKASGCLVPDKATAMKLLSDLDTLQQNDGNLDGIVE